MQFRNIAALIATAGLGLGLLGAGVGASFTQQGTATENIKVGTFDCQLSTTDGNAVISNSGYTYTLHLPNVESSTGASALSNFTLTATGSMPVQATWTVTTAGDANLVPNVLAPPITDGSTVTLAAGGSQTYNNVGFNWTSLTNNDLGQSASVVYTVNCTDIPCPTQTGVSFQQNEGTAGWNAACTKIELALNANADDNAYAVADFSSGLSGVGTSLTLPATAPSFVTNYYGAGTPRFVVAFTNGQELFGYPSQGGSTWEENASGTEVSYSKAFSDMGSYIISDVYIVLDTSGGVPVSAEISSISFGALNIT